jgi:type IV secretion system protein TrbL
MKSSFSDGAKACFGATGGTSTMGTIGGSADASGSSPASASRDGPPDWAKRMQRHRSLGHGATLAAHAVRSGDSHGGGSSINLSESDRS